MFYMQRYVWPMVNALFITSALLYAMFLLIESPPLELSERKVYRDLDWIHGPEETPVKPIEDKPKDLPVVEVQPEIPRYTAKFEHKVDNQVGIPIFKIAPPENDDIIFQSNQLTLILGYPPVYPPNKLGQGIEGYAQVGFSVNALGHVYDEFIIDAQPKGAFEKSALKAIAKFKYKPRYVEDKPVSTEGQSYIFRYRIE